MDLKVTGKAFEYDRPAASLEEATERQTKLQAEIKRLQGKCAEFAKELAAERRTVGNREQQILDLGRLLVKRKIDWRKEVEWTDHTAPPPPAGE